MKKCFDNIDTRILKALQRNGRLQNNELAKEIGLSNSACLRRVNQLEHDGVIDGYVALLNPKKVNCHLISYLLGTFNEENPELKERFIFEVKINPTKLLNVILWLAVTTSYLSSVSQILKNLII